MTEQPEFPAFTSRCPEGATELDFDPGQASGDSAGTMTLYDLARGMQKVTRKQMELLGWGKETVERTGVVWVVAWTSLRICHLPPGGERLRLRIWAGWKRLAMHVRKYAFFTEAGETVASAAVLFLPMDRKTRTLTADPAYAHPPVLVIPGEAEEPKLREPFPEKLPLVCTRTVRAGEIDENSHMNNACYLDWAESLCGPAYLETHEPCSVWIQYCRELKEGQTVTLHYGMDGPRLFVRGRVESADSFLALVRYRTRKLSDRTRKARSQEET